VLKSFYLESQNFIQFPELVTRYCGNSYSASTAVGNFLRMCKEIPRKKKFWPFGDLTCVNYWQPEPRLCAVKHKLDMHLVKASLLTAVAIYVLFRITVYPLASMQWLYPVVSLKDLFHLPCLHWNMVFCVFCFMLWVQWKHAKYLAIEVALS